MTRVAGALRLTRDQLWVAVVVLLPALASLLAPMSTVDLAYQVRAGQLTLVDATVLRTDPFTFTMAGEPWLNQQWGAQVLFGALYDVVGWGGLAIVRAVLVSAIVGLVFLAGRWWGASVRVAAGLALVGFLVGLAAMGLRPQLLGMLCFAIVGALVAGRGERPWLPWLVPVVALAWANLHGSFVLAPALVGVVLLHDLVAPRADTRRAAVRRDLVVLALTLVATFVTPFGAGAWSYALSLTVDPQVRELVTEWQPTSPLSPVGAGYYVSVVLAAVLVVRRPRAVAWPWLLWLVGLAALGAIAERGIAWWAVGAPPILAAVAMASLEQPARVPAPAEGSSSAEAFGAPGHRAGRGRSLSNGMLVLVLGLAIVILLPTWRGGDALYGPPGLLVDAPRTVTDALLGRVTSADRLFTAQRWGSWFELAVPDATVFVDSRIELFPTEVWDDYLAVSAAEPGWQEVLQRWDVTALAISAEEQPALLEAMATEGGWELVASDADGALYLRTLL